MLNFSEREKSCIILSFNFDDISNSDSQKIYEKCISILYSKDYKVCQISKHSIDFDKRSLLAYFESGDNDKLRKDALSLTDIFHLKNLIVKYSNEENFTLLNNNGSESLLEMKLYDGLVEEDFYVIETMSFYFTPVKRYHFPNTKQSLRNGMIVEFLDNNNVWKKRTVLDVNTEYEKLYKLLIQYKKLRVEIPQN